MINRIKIIGLLVSLCSNLITKGATETFSSRIAGPSNIFSGTSFNVQEGNYLYMLQNSPLWQSEFTNQSVKAYFELGWDEALQTNLITPYNYTVVLDLQGYNLLGASVGAPVQISLNITYDASNLIDKSNDIFMLPGYHKVGVKIVSILDAVSGSQIAPENMYLETRFVVDRFYDFPETSQHPVGVVTSIPTLNNELEINWTYLYGAEAYELEWTYVNNYATNFFTTGSTIPANAIPFTDRDFELNNTRVKTGFNKYVIPLVYDQGYIVYRVRGVGRDMNNLSHIIYGEWSELSSSRNNVADYFNYEITQAHDPDKNWQYVANYAEEGKKKEVVSYFDGSLRNRQSVTRMNTNNKTIVGETVYDHQGRAAIQTLPVPVGSSELKYFEDLNNNVNITAPNGFGFPYSRLDFDKDANCVVSTPPMDPNSGSSNYYSPQAATGTHQDLVPDAFGYPFTQIEYEPDNTGRIRRQSGVGLDHQFGSHETQYFYGKPHQEELDRLFSYNVGYKSRYKKNMVVDPNGQVSVTYIDPQGRTIATALAGAIPTNLDIVADEFGVNTFPAVLNMNIDILNKINPTDFDTPSDDNLLFNTGTLGASTDGLMVSLQENNPLSGNNYAFDYSLTTPLFNDGCVAKNYPVVYDVFLSMKDKCAEEQLRDGSDPLSTPLAINEVVGVVDITGSGTSLSYSQSTLVADNLPIGTYTVSKKISVNEAALDEYTEDYISSGQQSGCINTEEDFTQFYIDNSVDGCEVFCGDCLNGLLTLVGLTGSYTSSALPTLEEWMTIWTTNYTVSVPGPGPYSAVQQAMIDNGLTAGLWEEAFLECTDACTEISICESSYQMMLFDVSPGGIYFNTIAWNSPWKDLNADGITDPNEQFYFNLDGTPATVAVAVSSLNPSGHIPEIAPSVTALPDGNGGWYVYPHQLQNVNDFIGIFDEQWAQSLVYLHPEYCYYEQCMGLSNDHSSGASTYQSSEDFDTQMRAIQDYTVATTNYGTNFTTLTPNIASFNDPYFVYGDGNMTPSQLSYVNSRMDAALQNYQGKGKTMWEIAELTVSPCGRWYGVDILSCPTFSATPQELNDIWNTFKNLYLSEKQKIQADMADSYAQASGCFNGGIAIENRRFINLGTVNTSSSMNEVENDTDYKAWLLTGQCPNVFDLQLLLNGVIEDDRLTFPSLPLIDVAAFTPSLYKVISELDPTNNNYEQYTWIASGTGSLLTTTFSGLNSATTVGSCALSNSMLELDLQYAGPFTNSTNFNWGNYGTTWRIERFDQFTATSMNSFVVMAYVSFSNSPSGTPFTQMIINGTTCIPLKGCESITGNNSNSPGNFNATNGFNSACPSNELIQSVTYVMNDAILNGAFNTPHSITITPSNTPELQPIINQLSSVPTSIVWSLVSSSPTVVYDINNEIEVVFDGSIPTDILSIADPNPITDFVVEAKITRSTTGSVTFPYSPNPPYTPDIEDVTIRFELFNTYLSPSESIVVTNCCEDDGSATTTVLSPSSGNLIVNGDFNSVNNTFISNFTMDITSLYSHSCIGGNLNYVSGAPSGGNFIYNSQTAYASGIPKVLLSQTITGLIPGSYNLSFWWNHISGDNALFEIRVDGVAVSPVINSSGLNCGYGQGSSTWQSFSYPVTVTGSSAVVEIMLLDGDRNVLAFDDIEFIGESCPRISEDLSTGYNEITNVNLVEDNIDNDWIITLDPTAGSIVPRPAVVHDQNAVLAWGALAKGTWITLTQTPHLILNQTTAHFERTFNLPVGFSNPILSFEILADQSANLFLNGTFIGQCNSSSTTSNFIITNPLSFNVGQNVLRVELTGSGNEGPPRPTGFVLNGAISVSSCAEVCIECIPNTDPPVDCYTKYEEYSNFIANNTPLTLSNNILDPVQTESVFYPEYYITQEVFCFGAHKLSLDAYINYTSTLSAVPGVDPFLPGQFTPTVPAYVPNPFFVSFNNFVLNDLGLYVPQYLIFLNAISYDPNSPNYLSLVDFAAGEYTYKCVNEFINNNPQAFPLEVVCNNFAPQLRNCPKFTFPNFPEPPILPNPCEEYMLSVAAANGASAYNTYITQLTEDFRERYIKFAVENAVETFNMTYQDQEYHYTLYNYDQGGNLISTVPPRGVDRLDLSNPTNATAVKLARQNKTLPAPSLIPNHSYRTEYFYNTLNQLIQQETPDGGTSLFWYDYLGRLVASQNAEQQLNNQYSYTSYDALGRIIEVGQLTSVNAPDHLYNGVGLVDLNDEDFPYNNSWQNVTSYEQVTKTYYDEITTPIIPAYLFPNGQENLRNRVVRTTYQDVITVPSTITDYDRATHYSYDIHGNVNTLVQENKSMGLVGMNHQFKKIDYTYDLISGNVIQVNYQDGEVDAFYHKYEYDADNRITNAWTSEDGVLWEQDAKYLYYDHGPLARTEIGNEKVQGTDYAYTIQGWLKSNNGTVLNPTTEMGKDGMLGVANLNEKAGKDAYGFSLAYFNNDYSARVIGANGFMNSLTTSSPIPTNRQLYNGNIAQMAVALADDNENPIALLANNYTYDQLNRIKSMNSLESGSTSSYSAVTNNNKFASAYQYDPNGNIISLSRNEDNANGMDDLTYWYYDATGNAFNPTNTGTGNPSNATNRLAYVEDSYGASVLGTDIGGQSAGNYTYDAIGNLKTDASEGITDIIWTVYGKIKEIKKNGTDELEFEYDASGNRVTKIVKPDISDASGWKYTYYFRDASGNVMATYNYKPTNGTDPEELKLQEHHIYGSSRIGIVDEGKLLYAKAYEKQNFTTNLHGWYPTAPSDATLSNTIDNRMQVSTSAVFAGALYDVTTVPGKTYTVTLDIEPGASDVGLEVYDASYTTSFDNVNMPTTGQYSIVFTATTTVSHIKLYSYIISDLFYADNVEIAETGINPNEFVLYKGKRNFELTNHLGNVMSVVTDKKIAYLNSGNVSFEPNIISYNDYYPFGSLLPGRYTGGNLYRYGYQGSEKDDEIANIEGAHYTTHFRELDARLNRWWSRDPKSAASPWSSPYVVNGNNPIIMIDPMGDKEYESKKAYKEETGNRWSKRGQGDWLSSDRKNNTDTWKNANTFNLQQEEGYEEYSNIEQRAAFYEWFQGASDAKGNEIRWAGAAADVAFAINELANPNVGGVNSTWLADQMGYSSEEARSFANTGNRMIFEDVFPKLRTLYNGPVVKGQYAFNWDAMALSQEQNLIQPLYQNTSAFGLISASSKQLLVGSSILAKMKGIGIAPFPKDGNLMDVKQRWAYGMKGMGYSIKSSQMPFPGTTYQNGVMYMKFRKAGGN